MNLQTRALSLALITGVSSAMAANPPHIQVKEKIIKDVVTTVQIPLNQNTVRCSSVGYGQQELKVSVADLSWLTIFSHANNGEALPCVTAGPCAPGRMPENLLNGSEQLISTKVRVTLKETYTIDHAKKTCTRKLQEYVQTPIKQFMFRHFRSGEIGAFPYQLCNAI